MASQSNNDLWAVVLADNIRTILAGTRAVTQSNEERAARLDAENAHAPSACRRAEAASKAGQGQPHCSPRHSPTSPSEMANTMWQPILRAGTISVLGTSKQQELVQQYLDRVMQSAQRQVLIEATIVEITLKDQYRAGIDWSKTLQGATGWEINNRRRKRK